MSEVLFQALDGLEQELQAMEGEKVGEHRDEEIVCRHQRIEVEQPKRGWRVEDDQIVVPLDFPKSVLQFELAPGQRHQGKVDRAHPEVGGDEAQVRNRRFMEYLLHRCLANQDVQEGFWKILALVA